MKDLIQKYIELLKLGKYNSESYKWKAIEHFQKKWNFDAEDFFEMFKESFTKHENLIYQNAYWFLEKSAENFPKETKLIFENIFNESISFEERLKLHLKYSDELLIPLKNKLKKQNWNHCQDERTLSFILTMYDPIKYFLYKDNVYQSLCKYLGLTSQKSGKKYTHFSEIGRDLITEIKQSQTLAEAVKKYFPIQSNPIQSNPIQLKV